MSGCAATGRFEDVTPAEPLRLNPKADRDLLLYGYLRGAPLHTTILEFYQWTLTMLHVCVICCRFEDVTPAEPLRLNCKADRDLLLYGHLRGASLHSKTLYFWQRTSTSCCMFVLFAAGLRTSRLLNRCA
jgi:hypothetical protein